MFVRMIIGVPRIIMVMMIEITNISACIYSIILFYIIKLMVQSCQQPCLDCFTLTIKSFLLLAFQLYIADVYIIKHPELCQLLREFRTLSAEGVAYRCDDQIHVHRHWFHDIESSTRLLCTCNIGDGSVQ